MNPKKRNVVCGYEKGELQNSNFQKTYIWPIKNDSKMYNIWFCIISFSVLIVNNKINVKYTQEHSLHYHFLTTL